MSKRSFQQTVTGLSLMLTFVLFQNFDFSQYWKANVSPIHENGRREHARELLGRFYEGSWAHRAESIPALHMAIYNDVYNSLPKKFKPRAAAVTSMIIKESAKHNFDPVLVLAVIKTESSFNPLAVGGVGEIGLMQIRPETAEWIAKKKDLVWYGPNTLRNPVDNVRIGITYMSYLRGKFDGYANKYISAYNMGATKVRRLYASEVKPKEYSLKVMRHYKDTYAKLVTRSSFTLIAKATEAPGFSDTN